LLRTAKSCGPDAPTLASSSRRHVGPTGLRQPISADDGGKRARSPGRARRKPLKPLRAGMPDDPGGPVATTRVHYQLRTRGYGCSGHPAFPTPSKGREIHQRLGRIAPRGAKSRLLFDNRILFRRPCESRDPYTVPYRLSTKAETFCPNERRWLWVPAFAGTTKESGWGFPSLREATCSP